MSIVAVVDSSACARFRVPHLGFIAVLSMMSGEEGS